MTEFYVTYDRDGQRHLGVVFAPARPATLRFSNREELQTAMDSLGHDWQLRSEIQVPDEYAFEISDGWLKAAAETKAMQRDSQPEVNLWGGSFPGTDMITGFPFGPG